MEYVRLFFCCCCSAFVDGCFVCFPRCRLAVPCAGAAPTCRSAAPGHAKSGRLQFRHPAVRHSRAPGSVRARAALAARDPQTGGRARAAPAALQVSGPIRVLTPFLASRVEARRISRTPFARNEGHAGKVASDALFTRPAQVHRSGPRACYLMKHFFAYGVTW